MFANDLSLHSVSPDVDLLLERVRTLMINSKGSLTRSGYQRDFKHYREFCSNHGLVAIPASESTRDRSLILRDSAAASADQSRAPSGWKIFPLMKATL